uniref:Uncharacterized protein n=1 Tax=Knipowitschia caucasica TaxID=637954 RepID=A0AAV2J5C5_KNICA
MLWRCKGREEQTSPKKRDEAGGRGWHEGGWRDGVGVGGQREAGGEVGLLWEARERRVERAELAQNHCDS